MLRAVGRGIDTRRLGVAVRGRRPVPVHAAQRLRLGRHALAGHGDVPRALADGPARSATRRGSIPRRTPTCPPTPPSWSAARSRSGARPRSPGPVRDGLERYAADTLATADEAVEAGELPRAGAERAADARRHLPRLPHELTMDCCTEHARASAGLPAIEPGMPEPAGTGLSRRSFLLRCAGPRPGRLRRRQAREAARVRDRRRAGAERRAGHRAAERLPGRRRRLAVACSRRSGTRSTARLRPKLAAARRARVRRGPAAALAPGASTRWPTCTPRARSPSCPRSATPDADQSHFTSRHFWEVGALDPHLRTGWLGRVLDRVGSPDNPLQGVSLDGQLAPSLATARNPVAAIAKPEDVGFWTPGAWGPAEELAVPAFTGIGRSLTGSGDPAVAQAARAAAFAGGVRDALAPLGKDGKPAYTPAAAYPQTADAVPEAARRLRRDARRRPADPRRLGPRARRLRHARQPGGRRCRRTCSSRSTRCSPSSATSRRAGSPTAC